jgi:SAM-dependent methyltransferase
MDQVRRVPTGKPFVRPRADDDHGAVPEDHFDERIARGYDAATAPLSDPEVIGPTVDLLAELAGDGAALELAIGTGRVALPLHSRGVPVQGIDLSPAMVEQLRTKPGSDEIAVTIGDIATTRVDGTFRLAYLVFNTINNLTTQDEQVACFANAAAHLEPGGYFVIEVGVPDLRRLPPGETTRVFAHGPGYVGFDEYSDLVDQILWSHHWRIDGGDGNDGDGDVVSMPFRYVWPSELDLMARLAGLVRRERWSSWTREPFTADSPSHVSVWQKPT